MIDSTHKALSLMCMQVCFPVLALMCCARMALMHAVIFARSLCNEREAANDAIVLVTLEMFGPITAMPWGLEVIQEVDKDGGKDGSTDSGEDGGANSSKDGIDEGAENPTVLILRTLWGLDVIQEVDEIDK
ncbi:hypothetical protein EWM64_g9200 [Hericium alpestre]|uniref:Uncharacterized protein n=1 Tax=Hericium alpestre TaxID=135208 RepID=A0A4Y9ZJC2_9AGAM|nr:hypothetical protein EWM64_g9200 [Hericium alpestre]